MVSYPVAVMIVSKLKLLIAGVFAVTVTLREILIVAAAPEPPPPEILTVGDVKPFPPETILKPAIATGDAEDAPIIKV
jgi:hypothetical protein